TPGQSTAEEGSVPETIVLEDKGNVVFRLCDSAGNVLVSSKSATDADWQYHLYFAAVTEGENASEVFYTEDPVTEEDGTKVYTYDVRFLEGFPEMDDYRLYHGILSKVYELRYHVIFFIPLFSALAIFAFVILMASAARSPLDEELYPGPLNRIPFDVLAAIVAGGVGLFVYAICSAAAGSDGQELIAAGVSAITILVGGLGLCISMAARIKQKNLITGSFCYWLLMWLWKILKAVCRFLVRFGKGLLDFARSIPLVWKTCLLIAVVLFVELVAAGMGGYYGFADLAVFEHFIFIPAVLYLAIVLRRLQKGGEALASGDMSYHTDTKGMLFDFKKHGENLNNIAGGMNIAVSERLKSERMKTELITNVSHDIKTPLTSIINYATLIGQERTKNEKIHEYSEVLVRQSDKLKRLIEDLVEASKASTGNLEVHPVPSDASIFLEQASGEYEEKLQKAELTLVTSRPEQPVRIMADGRRMWRIFDNLMNNICKYAQPGTRVYLSLEEDKEKGNAVITFKNTSRDALNISEEELMERFTRGDSSRNTEGNGLGLSIARSMAELQGGTLKLAIDGDLFKAILTFPLI
ncbi:MAG: HAMP domain-containing sensor histidine kinase, partial [Erysipelotrichaceae bacterium]|nr:HAMP domain-containing sensor histidine kinase [Erysipelotrichaceae bacterium]